MRQWKITICFCSVLTLFWACNSSTEKTPAIPSQDGKADSTNLSAQSDIPVAVPDFSKQNVLYAVYSEDSSTAVIISANASTVKDNFFLSADANCILCTKYEKRSGVFAIVKSDTILQNEFVYTQVHPKSFEQTIISGQKYLMFSLEENPMGQATIETTVSFFAINLVTASVHELHYTGVSTLRCTSCVDGAFDASKTLDKTPDIKKALLKFASGSPEIFQPDKNNSGISYFKNYEQKWDADNGTGNHMANGSGFVPDTIYSTLYKEDLFAFSGTYDKDEVIENEQYKIVSYFRGNILAYNKMTHLYFPVLVQSCITGCNKTVAFVSPNEIKIAEGEVDNSSTIIDLRKIKFQ